MRDIKIRRRPDPIDTLVAKDYPHGLCVEHEVQIGAIKEEVKSIKWMIGLVIAIGGLNLLGVRVFDYITLWHW